MIQKTLEELEGRPLPPQSFHSSLVNTIYYLYSNKKISDFDAGDLRILIGQDRYLSILIPLALNVLEEDPWICGTYYEGDLLHMVIKANGKFWVENMALRWRMEYTVQKARLLNPDDPYLDKLPPFIN